LRRSLFLTVAGVAAGRVGTAIVATALAGVPFPDIAGLLRTAGVAAISAPLGPAAFAILRRLGRAAGSAP
jgi:hypothetical protein